PPITNRGVSKYQSGICPNGEIATDTTEPQTDSSVTQQLQRGGYDGGIEVGFEGLYLEGVLNLLKELEVAKQTASETSVSCPLEICGRSVLVECSGANAGLHYKYVFTLDGVKFLIHHKPPKNRHAIRIRYGATALIGNDFFKLHQKILEFLHDIGFEVTRECLSRVDLQVLVDEPIEKFVIPIFSGHAVSKARKDGIWRNCGKIETYTLGNAGRLQLCIYDKAREFWKCLKSDPVKFQLLARYCFGESWFNDCPPVTRIEFRLWRDLLREIGINTVRDLQRRENALVKFLTKDWFRILSSPKVRGHENTAAIHPVWEKVIQQFNYWFRGITHKDGEFVFDQPIIFNRDKLVSCDPELLEKQGLGCLLKSFALRFGSMPNHSEFRQTLSNYVYGKSNILFSKVNDKAKRIEVLKGVILGKETQDTEQEPPQYGEYACCHINPELRQIDKYY
ncbi:MAG: hypothetical protein LBH59_08610, partial [Planctomycetaceae bacterium]|nr:hypothetical protein [Planctomycetaceae bacterium]